MEEVAERGEERHIAFPDLDTLEILPVASGRDRKAVGFWNRLIAFYAYVRDQAGEMDYPHPSGVRLCPQDEERLRSWCSLPLARVPKRRRDLSTAMAWFDKGPGTDEEGTPGSIRLLVKRAYPERG